MTPILNSILVNDFYILAKLCIYVAWFGMKYHISTYFDKEEEDWYDEKGYKRLVEIGLGHVGDQIMSINSLPVSSLITTMILY